MVTREQFDAVKTDLVTAIAGAATREQAQFAALNTEVQALKDQIASGVPVTDQDLTDLQGAVTGANALAPAPAPAG